MHRLVAQRNADMARRIAYQEYVEALTVGLNNLDALKTDETAYNAAYDREWQTIYNRMRAEFGGEIARYIVRDATTLAGLSPASVAVVEPEALYPCPSCIAGDPCANCGSTGLVGVAVASVCPDCGGTKADPAHSWCVACTQKRYTQPERGRAFFYRGPQMTFDDLHGKGWTAAVTATAIKRAARIEAFKTLGRASR